jgi:hypothetical protein
MLTAIGAIASREGVQDVDKCFILNDFVGNRTKVATLGVQMGDSS